MGQCQVERVQPEPEERLQVLRAQARSFPPIPGRVGEHHGGTCAFFLEQVGNVPSVESQPMCSAVSRHPCAAVWAEADGKPLGQVAEWPCKSSLRPAWFSARSLGFQLSDVSSAVLRVEIRDAGTILAWSKLPMKGLELHKRLEVALETYYPGFQPTLSFQLLDSSVVLQPRKVYLVRHGESQWNKAQSKMDLHGMVRTTDHCLSAKGREQAEQLSQKLLELEKQRRPSAMLRPDVVMASPLGRALQTAVIGYGALAAKVGRSEMVLAPNCKEKQNLGGLDTHCTKMGQEILDSCSEELQGLYSNKKEAIASTFQQLQFDLLEVEDKWWVPGQSESAKQLQVRLEEFMYQLLFAPAKSIVVFGHSLFFQQLMRKYIPESYRQSSTLAQRLGTSKLPNCGVVQLDLEPSRMLDGPFVKAELMLGTELQGEAGCAMSCCAAESDTSNEFRPEEIQAVESIANVPNSLPGAGLEQVAEANVDAEAKVETTSLAPKEVPQDVIKKEKKMKKCCPL